MKPQASAVRLFALDEFRTSPSLWIFNPETELALACGDYYYTAPAPVRHLARTEALMPAWLASKGDAVLVRDPNVADPSQLKYYGMARAKGVEIVTAQQISKESGLLDGYTSRPWGWNNEIATFLNNELGGAEDIPSYNEIADLKRLAHRRNAINLINDISITDPEISLPLEIRDMDMFADLYNETGGAAMYLKAPWSSSGRGIMRTYGLEWRHIEPWARGVIAKQGSVIIEEEYERALDFATEWWIRNGEAFFLGYSIFKVSPRGKYISNLKFSVREAEKIIDEASEEWQSKNMLAVLKEALEARFGKSYNGPLGIDALVTKKGHVNPCVEINWRYTMGMVAIEQYKYEN